MKIPEVLQELLQLKRPHGGLGEGTAREIVRNAVIEQMLWPVVDAAGNIRVQLGEDNGLVFAAHLDTVHRADGRLYLAQVEVTHEVMAFSDPECTKAEVLGADDAAGVYILLRMLAAGVQGTYLFFVGEEVGGVGSSAFVQANPNFSANAVISFDRRGTGDVITHQGMSRTCSDAFAEALALAITFQPGLGLLYRPSDQGVYTDSKEFAHIVPECTNISVGYYNEHTSSEYLDLVHLEALADACCRLDWGSLPIQRVPEPEAPWYLPEEFNLSGMWNERVRLLQEAQGIRKAFAQGELSTYRLHKFLTDVENYLE